MNVSAEYNIEQFKNTLKEKLDSHGKILKRNDVDYILVKEEMVHPKLKSRQSVSLDDFIDIFQEPIQKGTTPAEELIYYSKINDLGYEQMLETWKEQGILN